MRLLVAMMVGISVIFVGAASAQTANSGALSKSTTAKGSQKTSAVAPVGDRQPTLADVGKADDDDARSQEDKELDRKIRNICKGC